MGGVLGGVQESDILSARSGSATPNADTNGDAGVLLGVRPRVESASASLLGGSPRPCVRLFTNTPQTATKSDRVEVDPVFRRNIKVVLETALVDIFDKTRPTPNIRVSMP